MSRLSRLTNAFAVIALLLLPIACSNAVTITGATEDGETFTGVAANDGGIGSGIIQLVSNRGLTCVGKYIYTDASHGRAALDCNNGKTGTMQFTASQWSAGFGDGVIDGRPMRFTFK